MHTPTYFLTFFITVHLAVTLENFKVYRLLPTTEDQLLTIVQLTKSEDYDVWTPIVPQSEFVDVMVQPKDQQEFCNKLDHEGIKHKILIEDVGKLVEKHNKERLAAPKLKSGEITFDDYNTWEQIEAYLHKLAKTSKHVSLQKIGRTTEGRNLEVIQISSNASAKHPIIFIDGGIHAREWISPAVVLYFIRQLVQNPENSNLLNNVDWHILPVLNPDGYAYTFSNDRMWRKTRSINTNIFCAGVDSNRNFGYQWGKPPSSPLAACSQIYKGKTPFSEPENAALRDHILGVKDRVKLYLTFHSYGNLILLPWSYTSKPPHNIKELRELGKEVAKSIYAHAGTMYKVIEVTSQFGRISGTSLDWAKGAASVDLAYAIELPGKYYGFVLPPKYIWPVVKETWSGMLKFHEYIESKYVN